MPAWEWDLRGSEWLTEFSRTFSKKRVEKKIQKIVDYQVAHPKLC